MYGKQPKQGGGNSGTLIVSPLCAKLTYDADVFSKMDPYCIVRLGAQERKTQTCNSGGKTPNWNDTLQFQCAGEHQISVVIFDKDPGSDDFIGELHIPLQDIYTKRNYSSWYNVTRKGKGIGQIMIKFEFMGAGKDKAGKGGMGTMQQMGMGMMHNQGHMMQPGMQQPMMHQPMMQQPMMMQQGMMQPQMQPGMMQPHMQPGMMQPQMQPGMMPPMGGPPMGGPPMYGQPPMGGPMMGPPGGMMGGPMMGPPGGMMGGPMMGPPGGMMGPGYGGQGGYY